MFYRAGFYKHLVPLGPGNWGVPLMDVELVELLERVPA
jgi:hypothetical protein